MVSSLKNKNLVSGFFLALTAFYCLFFLYKPGFIGYANNYDFVRHSSCLGLWSYIPDHPKKAGHASSPSSQLLYDGDIAKDSCLRSSDNVSSYILTRFLSVGDIVSFINLSSIKLFFLLALSFLAILTSTARLVPSIFLFSILSEGIYLAYANTLYGEFSVISAFTLIIICSYNLIHKNNRKYSTLQIAILIIGIIWLGLSKQQWSYLTLLLLCITSWLVYHRTLFKKPAFVFLFLSLASIFTFQFMNKHNFDNEKSISSANKINTFFFAVLPEATDKIQALKVLGLPEHCNVDIGISWYHPEQNALNNCPEIQKVSRARLLKLFIQDSATFFIPIKKFTGEMRLFYPDYLGVTIPGDTNALKKLNYVTRFSLSNIIFKIESSVFFTIVFILFIASIVTGLFLLFVPKKPSLDLTSNLYLFTTGGITVGYSILSSVFGDGYFEAAKHSVLFLGGVYLQLIAVLFTIILYIKKIIKYKNKTNKNLINTN
ncbi:MAG: hypothetical protein WC951_13770 [Bacteroidales bacterium]|nr:hypothetical protein [Tenuifilaceae bacterium]